MNGANIVEIRIVEDSRRDDLLFTDIVMPHMSGKELSDSIRAIYPPIKDSACTESALVHQGVLNEYVMLLQKPFTSSTLAQ